MPPVTSRLPNGRRERPTLDGVTTRLRTDRQGAGLSPHPGVRPPRALMISLLRSAVVRAVSGCLSSSVVPGGTPPLPIWWESKDRRPPAGLPASSGSPVKMATSRVSVGLGLRLAEDASHPNPPFRASERGSLCCPKASGQCQPLS